MVKAFIFLTSKSGPLLYYIKEVMLHRLGRQGDSENCEFGELFCVIFGEIFCVPWYCQPTLSNPVDDPFLPEQLGAF